MPVGKHQSLYFGFISYFQIENLYIRASGFYTQQNLIIKDNIESYSVILQIATIRFLTTSIWTVEDDIVTDGFTA